LAGATPVFLLSRKVKKSGFATFVPNKLILYVLFESFLRDIVGKIRENLCDKKNKGTPFVFLMFLILRRNRDL
jgi:hypothetical protein